MLSIVLYNIEYIFESEFKITHYEKNYFNNNHFTTYY